MIHRADIENTTAYIGLRLIHLSYDNIHRSTKLLGLSFYKTHLVWMVIHSQLSSRRWLAPISLFEFYSYAKTSYYLVWIKCLLLYHQNCNYPCSYINRTNILQLDHGNTDLFKSYFDFWNKIIFIVIIDVNIFQLQN